ncbi:MAG: toxic anion resistance protein [Clostridia bacterium]|nr:toxic anion resistance protein [Clostridia bacterium]
MGIDFNNVNSEPAAVPTAQPTTAQPIASSVSLIKEEPKKYDIVADRNNMTAQLTNSAEIDRLAGEIKLNDLNSIVKFGAEAADKISKASDVVLKNADISQLNDSSTMLNTLAKIMSAFDADELSEKKGRFGSLFVNERKKIEKILHKYNSMGDEVDKIYVQLKQYENEIGQTNRRLEDMFEANIEYYHQLVKYILAGEQGCQEIQNYITKRKSDLELTGDSAIQFEIQSCEQALGMLEQRVSDLRTAESVAMQSVPLIKTMEFSNYNLVRKIDSAFIITLPVFKQALAQAIMLKRQKIQADALSALDQKTNELLVRNAQNTVEQSKMIARLSSGSSIKTETLETTWQIIMDGIQETRNIQEDAKRERIDAKARLENIKQDFYKNYHMPNSTGNLIGG